MFDEETLLALYAEIDPQSRYTDQAQSPICKDWDKGLEYETNHNTQHNMSVAEMCVQELCATLLNKQNVCAGCAYQNVLFILRIYV